MCALICFIYELLGGSGDFFHVALTGDDVSGCGAIALPCKSLDYVINVSQSGDTVKLNGDNLGTIIFGHCGSYPILKNLTLEGMGLVSLHCNGTEFDGYHTPLLLRFKNASLTLKNVRIVSSHILISNGNINILDSVFEESAIFLMDEKYYKYYFNPSILVLTLVNDIQSGYLYWVIDGLGDSAGIIPLTCFSTTIVLNNVTWSPQKNGIPPPVDISQLGVQAICQDINIAVTSSDMADNPIYLFSVTNLNINIYNSAFEGPEQGSLAQGGLKINSFCYPKMIVENSTFKNLKYSDIGFAQMASLIQHPAAVSIQVQNFGWPTKLPGINIATVEPYGYHMHIVNCTFAQNFRAVAVNSEFQFLDILKILVEGCDFLENQVGSDGGGIYMDKGKNISMEVLSSQFISNKAGVNPFDVELNVVGAAVFQLPRNPNIKVYGYDMVSEGQMKLEVEFFLPTADHPFQNKSVFLNLRGSGGAISIQNADTFEIKDCLFVNNTASSFGGAIYAGNKVDLKIEQVVFISGHVPSTLTGGMILHSYSGNLYIFDTSFEVLHTSPNAVSALFHSGGEIRYSLTANNITVHCPINSRLKLQNMTNDLHQIKNNLLIPRKSLTLNELIYSCELCSEGYYSLSEGYIRHIVEEISSRKKREVDNSTSEALFAPPPPPPPPPVPPIRPASIIFSHEIFYTDVMCHICPYGGVCLNGIKAKANYWGMEVEGVVTFYSCPPGYCCSEPTCNIYNECKEHRIGTLCSKCEPGYSEALFSTTCLLDDQCNQYWLIPVTALLIFLYAMFLMHQNDPKDFVLGAPIGKNTFKRTVSKWTQSRKLRKLEQQPRILQVTQAKISNGRASKPVQNENEVITEETVADDQQKFDNSNNDEGGIFLILLFYYFQDAAIVSFKPIYAKATDPIVTLVKDFLAGLFKFQLDVLVFAGNICPFPGLTPVSKVWFKLLFVPFVVVTLLTIYGFSKTMLLRQRTLKTKWEKIAGKAAMALMLATLFSYQRLASSCFSLIYCVPVADGSVLFIDGGIQCLESWQIVMVFYIFMCVVPFGFYICVFSSLLAKHEIGIGLFFLGCLFPLPVMVAKMLQRIFCSESKREEQTSSGESESLEGNLVYNLLQGPYREYVLPVNYLKCFSLCWSGILIIRRLALIVIYTYIYNALLRLLVMSLISFLALLHHLMVKPCKENRANAAGTLSCAALFSICIINLVRATFEVAEVIPEGYLRKIMDALELIEDSLLFWIPLIGASVMILYLFVRVSSVIVGKKCKHSK